LNPFFENNVEPEQTKKEDPHQRGEERGEAEKHQKGEGERHEMTPRIHWAEVGKKERGRLIPELRCVQGCGHSGKTEEEEEEEEGGRRRRRRRRRKEEEEEEG